MLRSPAKTTVTSTGRLAVSEVVQVYLALPAAASSVGAAQPPRCLMGFHKVELAPGAYKQVVISVNPPARNYPLSF